MATRVGGTTLNMVARLQEARKDLEADMGFPVTASLGKDLRLLAFPRTAEDRAKCPARWGGFPVEVREEAE